MRAEEGQHASVCVCMYNSWCPQRAVIKQVIYIRGRNGTEQRRSLQHNVMYCLYVHFVPGHDIYPASRKHSSTFNGDVVLSRGFSVPVTITPITINVSIQTFGLFCLFHREEMSPYPDYLFSTSTKTHSELVNKLPSIIRRFTLSVLESGYSTKLHLKIG